MKKVDKQINQNIDILAHPLNGPYIVKKEKVDEILNNTDSLVNRQKIIENSEIFQKNNLSSQNPTLVKKYIHKK